MFYNVPLIIFPPKISADIKNFEITLKCGFFDNASFKESSNYLKFACNSTWIAGFMKVIVILMIFIKIFSKNEKEYDVESQSEVFFSTNSTPVNPICTETLFGGLYFN